MWELFPFPDETDLESFNQHYLRGVCIAGVLVLIVLTVGLLTSRIFGNETQRKEGSLSSHSLASQTVQS